MKMIFIMFLLLAPYGARAEAAHMIDPCQYNGKNSLWDFVHNYKGPSDERSRIKDVINRSTFNSTLTVAVLFGYDEILREMLGHKNVVKAYGGQALYLAASLGRLGESSTLVGSGISPNVEIDHGLTPIFAAVQFGCVREMKLLIRAGADINHKANVRWTLLSSSVSNGNYGAARLLIQNGYIYSEDEKRLIRRYLDGLQLESKYGYIFSGIKNDGGN